MPNLDELPQPIKQAMLHALIRAGAKAPSEENPLDDTQGMLVEAIGGTSLTKIMERLENISPARRMATAEEAAELVKLAGPCRFKPGDRIKWNPALYCDAWDFPGRDDVSIVTQVLNPPVYSTRDVNSSLAAVRHDIALAYIGEEGLPHEAMGEFIYDSRRFVLAED